MPDERVDVIVIGAGHAGVEAAAAAARLGLQVVICTLSPDTVAHMPCNPAIGGTAKSHLVREIDALGGLMARAIDATGIQFRLLNRSRGPAVWAPRAQADKGAYSTWVRRALEATAGISFVFGQVERLIVSHGRVAGVAMTGGQRLSAASVVVTTGTFLNGIVHVGDVRRSAGRHSEPAAVALADSIASLGFTRGRLKTGTPPRLHRRTIDYSLLEVQPGDTEPVPLSMLTVDIPQTQICCHVVRTTPDLHAIVRRHIDASPLYNGQITGIGPRYCPSLEDKVMRFPDKESHQLFLEPEGPDVDEVYVNGCSMSLPASVQEKVIRSLPGLEAAEIVRPGYAVEYDFVQPYELHPTFETRRVGGLYFAGQLNGTSGYEEAAGQGLLAGANAALRILGRSPLIIDRSEGYLGVMSDDLISHGCLEPYRMFTSRAEYRLLLRIDNADLRLTPLGRQRGLVDDQRWHRFEARRGRYERNRQRLAATMVRVAGGERAPATEALRRPDIRLAGLIERGDVVLELDEASPSLDVVSLDTDYRYAGYLKRQQREVSKMRHYEHQRVPPGFVFTGLPGLSRELQERLESRRPVSVGRAGRIPGMTPAALALIAAAIDRHLSSDRASVETSPEDHGPARCSLLDGA